MDENLPISMTGLEGADPEALKRLQEEQAASLQGPMFSVDALMGGNGSNNLYGTSVPMPGTEMPSMPQAPEAAPQADTSAMGNLFDMISNKYKGLQEAGEVGPASEEVAKPGSPSNKLLSNVLNTQPKGKSSVSDMLSKIYGPGLDDAALKEAQSSRGRQELLGNLTKAGSQIGAAISMGHGW